jgi:hypothetical protein
MNAPALMLQSRKFWYGFLGVGATILVGYLVKRGIIPADQYTATVAAIVSLSGVAIGATAHEDAAKTSAAASVEVAKASIPPAPPAPPAPPSDGGQQ